MSSRRLFAVALFVGAALLILVMVLRRQTDKANHAQEQRPDPVEEQASVGEQKPITELMPAREVRSSPSAPVIDAVNVYPSSVCAGEEAVAEVKAHVSEGDDPAMHVVIDGVRGDRVPVVGKLSLQGAQRPIVAHVFAGNGEMTSVPIPLEVRDCGPASRAVISGELLQNSRDDFEFTARVFDAADRGHKPALLAADVVDFYRWDFGDGTTAQSDAPTIQHSYAERVQKTRESDYLVTVEAVLKRGGYVKGHTAVEVENAGLQVLMDKDKVLIMASLTPRYAEVQADGSVTQSVRLFHVMPDDVQITSVQARFLFNDERRDLERPKRVDVSSVLGTTTIPAGHGTDVVAHISADDPAVAMVTYTLTGRAKDGRPAAGSFSIMRPLPAPTKENATEITDAKMVAKILAARKILNKPYVNREEIARLVREGRI